MRDRIRIAAKSPLVTRRCYPALGAAVAIAGVSDAALLRVDPPALSVVIVLVVGAVLGLAGRHPVAVALGVAGLVAVTAIPAIGDAAPDVSFLAPAISAYAVAASADRMVAIGVLLALLAALEIGGVRTGNWVPWLYVALVPWTVGRIVRSRRQLVTQLEARTLELDRERHTFARLAVRRERAQIARDLHDIVSHNMAVMIVQAGAGRVAPAQDPYHLAASFRHIRAAGDAALAEMDQLVDVLGSRTPGHHPGPTLDGISGLVAQARAAGLDVTAFVEIEPGTVPPEIQRAAYRAIQEGLTNVLKHAPGARVELRVEVCDQCLEIKVNNIAASGGQSLARSGAGSGLSGVRERVRAGSGEFFAGPTLDGGWRFAVRLPFGPTT